MNRKFVGLLTLAASFTVAACDSDSALDLSGELTELESQELGIVLLSTSLGGALTPTNPATSGPAAAPFSFQSSVDGDAPCDLGGDVRVTGSAMVDGDDATGIVDVGFTLTQAHRGCVVESDEGKRFTLTGAPNIQANFEMFTNANGGFEAGGSMVGGIQWESDGLAGVCEVDVTYSAGGNENDGHFTGSMSGSICGFSISHQVSYGVPVA